MNAEIISIERQPLPCPDEAPLTECPHCGKEYEVTETDEAYEDYEKVEGIPCILLHKPCGKLVRMVIWADDLTYGLCKLGLQMNDAGECHTCPQRTREFN